MRGIRQSTITSIEEGHSGMADSECERQMHTPLLPYSSWEEEEMQSIHDFL